MRFQNDTRAAIRELERQRTGEIYESADAYRCENGCMADKLFFVDERVLCGKCLIAELRGVMAEVLELARMTREEYTEVFDLLADFVEDTGDDVLLEYAQYYYAQIS